MKDMFYIFLMTILILSCSEVSSSVASEPVTTASITGEITFSGNWPTEGEITLSLLTNWPPSAYAGMPPAWTYIYATDLDANNKFNYTFNDVDFGTYGMLMDAYTDPMNSENASNKMLIGSHSGSMMSGYMDATPIILNEDNYQASYNIDAYLNYAFPCGSYNDTETCSAVEGCEWMSMGETEHCMLSMGQ